MSWRSSCIRPRERRIRPNENGKQPNLRPPCRGPRRVLWPLSRSFDTLCP
jgi:hypothetical protein